ncbi:MAG: S-adenosylmethionine decarboxylase [bacterium]|nr:S-adenosylmethionine decarboxylase [bacterium]
MTIQSTLTINHISAIIKLASLSNSLDFIENLGKDIITGLKLTIVKKIDNKFEPIGRTLVYLLSESHLAIHTWPEFNTIHIDLLSCGNIKITDFDRVLASTLRELKVVDYKSESHKI